MESREAVIDVVEQKRLLDAVYQLKLEGYKPKRIEAVLRLIGYSVDRSQVKAIYRSIGKVSVGEQCTP